MRKFSLVLLAILLTFSLMGCFGSKDDTYSVSGKITNSSGQGIAGVSIALGASGIATTNADGSWSKDGLSGTITVIPTKTGWTFTPQNIEVTKARTDVNFVGAPVSYAISGTITLADGTGIADVTLTLSNGTTSLTDQTGAWSATDLTGSITVTPSKANFAFNPETISVSAARNDVNFVGTPQYYEVSGKILDDSQNPFPNVTITFSGGFGETTTDANGCWSKANLSGTVTITPVKENWVFNPVSFEVTAGRNDVNFTGSLRLIQFSDANFEQAIRTLISKPSGDIYPSDVAQITTLDLDRKDILSLGGIEDFKNLTYLRLTFNPISNIEPLAKLPQMQILDISNNDITDISPLLTLVNLEQLFVYNNHIVDITALTNMTKLKIFMANDNQIVNLTPLAGLAALSELYLTKNPCPDLSPLANLSNLIRIDLGYALYNNLQPLAQLSLKELSIINGYLSDISPLGQIHTLERLFIGLNNITDITALSNLTNLNSLSIYYNQISDISALANLTNLTTISLSSNLVADLSALSGLPNLEQLWLDHNNIEDIQALADNLGIGQGDYVNLTYNYLNITELNPDVDNLKILNDRGVNIQASPQN